MEIKSIATGAIIAAGLYLVYDKVKCILNDPQESIENPMSTFNTKSIFDSLVSVIDECSSDPNDEIIFQTFAKEAKKCVYASDKMSFVRKIYNMAKDKDKTTKTYAIKAIGDICGDMIYSSDREQAMEYAARLY